MKNFKFFLWIVLALLGQNLSAQTEVKKPADVFEMYFNTFVTNDNAALGRLNDYLRPTVEGKNAYEIDFKATSEEMLTGSVSHFLASFSKDAADNCKIEAEEYFKALMDNFKNGTLSVKSAALIQNEYVKEQKIAEIIYSVSFKVPSKLPDMPGTDTKKIKPAQLKKYLVEATKKFKNADKIVTTEQKFALYQLKETDKIYYWNGSPDEIVAGLTDFYFESFGPK